LQAAVLAKESEMTKVQKRQERITRTLLITEIAWGESKGEQRSRWERRKLRTDQKDY
jgi:hypothetical protein